MHLCHTRIANTKASILIAYRKCSFTETAFCVYSKRIEVRKCPWFLLCQLMVKNNYFGGWRKGEECTSCFCKQLDTNKISDLASQSIPSSVLKRAASNQGFIWLMISVKVISIQNEKVTNQIAVPPSHYCCLGMCFIDCLSIPAQHLLPFNVLIIAGEN